MERSGRSFAPHEGGLPFWLLGALLCVIWIAGGASRPDVPGQAVVRFASWACLLVAALSFRTLTWRPLLVPYLVLGSGLLVLLLQMVPLPPSLWTALPGRSVLEPAATIAGAEQPWRPMSMVPSGTVNAFHALVVPLAVLVLAAKLDNRQRWKIAGLLVGLVLVGCVLAFLQFAGANFDNPLINYERGSVSGNMANRNHFALFVAAGCLLLPVWGFADADARRWRQIAVLLLSPFFLLVVLATGSRSGVVLAAVAVVAALLIVRTRTGRASRPLPKRTAAMLAAGAIGSIALVVGIAVASGRAVGIDRLLTLDAADDMRSRAFPHIAEMIGRYFPAGSGFGTFDPVYRIHEPAELLNPLYLNHAHNDWLELVLEGGLPAALLLVGAAVWILLRAVAIWRGGGSLLGKCGIAIIGLLAIASLVDYPARTPLFMAILALAITWLVPADKPSTAKGDGSTLRRTRATL